MNRLPNSELADIHLFYGMANCNARRAARMYRARFPTRHVPSPETFQAIHQRLRETGTFRVARLDAGRPRAARQPEMEDAILQHFQDHPTTSTRAAANVVNVSHSVVWRVLHDNTQHPYRIQRVQALNVDDYAPRVQFATWFLQQDAEQELASKVLFTDEAAFTREGMFNVHNQHVWANVNPHATRQRGHQVRFTVNVWAGIIDNYLIGPYVLPDRLDGRIYGIFLREVLPELLENIPLATRRGMWFQHDGAPPHFAIAVRQLLDDRYPNRWMGRGGPVSWPARSPDMTPLDFYVWGHLKSLVYETPVPSAEELIGRIVDACERIRETPGIFERVRQSLRRRLRACIDAEGRHFEQFL